MLSCPSLSVSLLICVVVGRHLSNMVTFPELAVGGIELSENSSGIHQKSRLSR